DARDGRSDEIRLESHVDEPHWRRGGARRVEGRQDEVARERGLRGDPRGLAITDLADEHDVGVAAEDRTEGHGKGQPGGWIDLDLLDAVDLVLDWILDRHGAAPVGAHLEEGRVE